MTENLGWPERSDGRRRPDVTAALVVSAVSVGWTVAASTLAVAIGLARHTGVLVAFGAVGVVDAIGSIALVYHFHHARRHDQLSAHIERVAHRIVVVGLAAVGAAAVIGGGIRLGTSRPADAGAAGIVLAAVSLVILIVLSIGKRRVARRISSRALAADGHLSAVGAGLAAVTLLGTAVEHAFGWHWADGAATVLVGAIAISLAVSTWRNEG